MKVPLLGDCLTDSFKHIRAKLRTIATFGVVGVMATLTHFVVGLSLTSWDVMIPFWANIVAFVAAFGISYVGHRTYTFRSGANHAYALPRFFAVACGGLVLNQIIVFLTVNLLGFLYWQALIIIVLMVPIVVYAAGRFWVFAPPRKPTDHG